MGDTAADARRIIGHIHGGRVLDVATGRGGFIPFLADGLADYDEIVGIEIDADRQAAFEAATAGRRDVRFVLGDFLGTALEPGSFDTVAVSASLHHFDDPEAVLRRMRDLVRPCGWIVVSEMYRDGQTDAQLTEVAVHDWMAEVDTATGGVHRPTFTRAEIVTMVDALRLDDVRTLERRDLLVDPHDPDAVRTIADMIDRYAAKAGDRADLAVRAPVLRTRLAEVGVHEATILVVTGRRSRT
jgi:SAM-dependent methyltransferase